MVNLFSGDVSTILKELVFSNNRYAKIRGENFVRCFVQKGNSAFALSQRRTSIKD